MNASLSLSSLTGPLSRFFGRYHATIFFTIVVLLLAGAILSLYLASANTTPTSGDTTGVISSNFDKTTEQEIEQLRDRNEPVNELQYPRNRANPFIE
jgi:hypothetical protein